MQGGQQTRREEKELLEWFSATLQFRHDDNAVLSFDNLKNGVAVVQLLHSIAPDKLDLARCDFLASKQFHYEKNWKLAQEATDAMQLDVKIEVDGLVLGDRHRALYALTQYLKHHYDLLKRKFIMAQEGSGVHRPTAAALRSTGQQPQALGGGGGAKAVSSAAARPPRAIPTAGPSATASAAAAAAAAAAAQASAAAPSTDEAAASAAAAVAVQVETAYQVALRRQQTYNPGLERRSAAERRNKRLLARSLTDLQTGEAASHTSGGSVGVRSFVSSVGGQLSGRGVATNSPSVVVEQWARGVQTPRRDSSRGSTPTLSPALDFAAASITSQTSGGGGDASAAASMGSSQLLLLQQQVGELSPSSILRDSALPSERSPSVGEHSSPAASAPRTAAADVAQQLAAQMQLHRYESLASVNFFSLVRRHVQSNAMGDTTMHSSSTLPDPLTALLPAAWGSIHDVEGDATCTVGYIPYEQLVLPRPHAAASPHHQRQQQQASSATASKASSSPLSSSKGGSLKATSAWEAFDTLFA